MFPPLLIAALLSRLACWTRRCSDGRGGPPRSVECCRHAAPVRGAAPRPRWVAALLAGIATAAAAEPAFDRRVLQEAFVAEGAALGDVDRDGHVDAVAGPYVHLGPDFRRRLEIYPPQVFDPLKYSDNFAVTVVDLNGDAWPDVAVIGFPGAEAFWYENPAGRSGEHWPRHLILEGVGNESAQFADLTGDGRLDLLAVHERQLGYATADPRHPRQPWTFHPVTPPGAWQAFTHGLGHGDIDGDGRTDLITHRGWWQQPGTGRGGAWVHHPADFGPGGAQMLVMDVNGDGRPDVLTSLAAHGYGISWFEQRRDAAGAITFHAHPITSAQADEPRQGVQFSQPHALALGDLDGDGLLDLVVGKRWWAHGPTGDPEPNAAAVLYGFLLRRDADHRVRYVPVQIDDASGVGTQFEVRDINGDGRADIVTSNKRGTFLFLSQPAAAAAADSP